MKNITQQFNSGFEPFKALLIYRYDKAEEISQFQRDEKRTEIYVESYDIGRNGKPINAHPLNDKEVSVLSDLLQTAQETKSGYLKSKSVALINRINRFFGTNWRAETIRYDKASIKDRDLASATITISCVDTVDARYEIAEILKHLADQYGGRNRVQYWMDFGNSRSSGQVILSTLEKIKQPDSELYRPVETLPLVTDEFKDLLSASEQADHTPSCSLAEALTKQDLFINSALANCGASLLWQLFREGILFNRGFFLNLQDFRTQPLKIA
ncbi:PRTRC system ThiF family protein [Mucilaginibacter sp. AK015]|uniref:PRTRC system ThiF family protein n=1 Tax=Mucilaginibacter sp. AK015 TaxID=2723072 RepID=UPI00160D8203|nr:PRTRC system ThiF family protein [Mucilaginibacter sp. AK015]MBB5395149.1 PRTRC genetic system ThiF family protein [Mucilaginibacter sp. AK015]